MSQIPSLSRQELRKFGFLTGIIVAVLFSFIIPIIRGHSFLAWPLIVTTILWALASLAPSALKPIYYVWMRIGLVLGFINTRIILGITFYGMVFPIGLLMRLLGKVPIAQDFDMNIGSYRLSSKVRTKDSMERPY